MNFACIADNVANRRAEALGVVLIVVMLVMVLSTVPWLTGDFSLGVEFAR